MPIFELLDRSVFHVVWYLRQKFPITSTSAIVSYKVRAIKSALLKDREEQNTCIESFFLLLRNCKLFVQEILKCCVSDVLFIHWYNICININRAKLYGKVTGAKSSTWWVKSKGVSFSSQKRMRAYEREWKIETSRACNKVGVIYGTIWRLSWTLLNRGSSLWAGSIILPGLQAVWIICK